MTSSTNENLRARHWGAVLLGALCLVAPVTGCGSRAGVERNKVDPEAAKKEREDLMKARVKEWSQ
jgi:hypothetical protein